MRVATLAACVLLAATGVAAASSTQQWYSACPSGTRTVTQALLGGFPLPGQTPDAAHLSVTYEVVPQYDAACTAWGFYNDDVETTGWSYLHIETNEKEDANTQMYAGGYLEGVLTTTRLYQSKIGSIAATFPTTNGTVPQPVYDWIQQQNEWVASQAAAGTSAPSKLYWQQVAGTYAQVQGIYDGYQSQATSSEPLSLQELMVLNLLGEVGDIQIVTNSTLAREQDVLRMHDLKKVKATMDTNSHCSAMIRLSPDGEDLWSAHTTWTEYASMLRVYKYYKFGIEGVAAQLFSAYPGTVSSIDDYYQTSNDMVVIETTNNVANMSLYEYVVPETVPTFVRVVVANQIADNGEDWSETFALYNSGTYNNQWMVVDNKQFTPASKAAAAGTTAGAAEGTLWIASQIPGDVVTQDVTSVLVKQGAWYSYNIPFFQSLWYSLGYGELVQQYGADGDYLWSYDANFRALIFARDGPKVSTLDDMRAIMQENNWQTDPLSRGSSDLAIASRMDLGTGPLSTPAAMGAIDAKLSAASTDSPLTVYAKSGPTCETQAPFVWSTSAFADTPHPGMPDKYDFDWVTFVVVERPTETRAIMEM